MKKVGRLRISPKIMPEDRSQHNPKYEPVAVRTTGRIKKPKAVLDPSDNYAPKAHRSIAVSTPSSAVSAAVSTQENRNSLSRMSTTSSDTGGSAKDCIVCGKRESKRPAFALKNPLLTCVECENKIHKHCLKEDYVDFEQVRQSYRCENCTPCSICHKSSNMSSFDEDFKTIVCSICAMVFHQQCLQQNSTKQNDDTSSNWKCRKCISDLEMSSDEELPAKKIREIIGDSSESINQKTTSNEKDVKEDFDNHIGENGCNNGNNSQTEPSDPITVNPKEKPICSPKYQFCNDIPDVHNWSVDQVFDYFYETFPKEAYVFKDQEIDGRSLLLLKRSDVVKKLPLKLGPSLRLYSAILKIQGQQNDPTLGWNIAI